MPKTFVREIWTTIHFCSERVYVQAENLDNAEAQFKEIIPEKKDKADMLADELKAVIRKQGGAKPDVGVRATPAKLVRWPEKEI